MPVSIQNRENLSSEKRRYKMDVDRHQQSSATVESLFADVITKIKSETEEAIAKIKSETEEAIAEKKARADKIAMQKARIRAEAEEKEKSCDETIAGIKVGVEKTRQTQAEKIAKIRQDAEKFITHIKAEYKKQIADPVSHLTGTPNAEKLQNGGPVKAEAEKAIAGAYTETETEMTDNGKNFATEEVFKSIGSIKQSSTALPGKRPPTVRTLCAKDIMQTELVWATPEDSIKQTFAKMRRHNTGYVMVGRNGVLEGIVSKSDLAGAISPYLRPEFIKWRRPQDDATLQIKLKWIIKKPSRITPLIPIAAIMKNMCRFRMRALPVVDQQGKVLGLVTEFSVFKALLKLKSKPKISATPKPSPSHW